MIRRIRGWLASPQAGRLALIAITLLAGAIRLYRLDAESLWLDETHTWRVSLAPFSALTTALLEMEYPPLYPALLNLWVKLFGDSEVALRFLSLLAGIVTVPVLGWGATRLLGRGIGLTAALFLALSPFHIWYSQEARPYALFGLLVLLSSLALAEAWRSGRRSAWLAYGILTLLSCYTHYYTVFYLAGQALFVGLATLGQLIAGEKTPRWRSWIVALIGVALLYLPWLPFLPQHRWNANNWIGLWLAPMSLLKQLWRAFRPVLLGTTAPNSIPHYLFFGVMLVGLWPGLAFLRQIIGRFRPPEQRSTPYLAVDRDQTPATGWLPPELILVAAVALAPAILAWIVSQVLPLLFPRYLLPSTPFALVLVARGVWQIRQAIPPARLSAVTAVVLVLALTLTQLDNLRVQIAYPSRPDWRGAISYVIAHAEPGDGLAVEDEQHAQFEVSYYLRGRLPVVTGLASLAAGGNPQPATQQMASLRRLWFIRVQMITTGSQVRTYLDSHYPRTDLPQFQGFLDFARYDLP